MTKAHKQENFDIIILGGGINGCAIARDAVLRGLKPLLIEANDFGCGASSKSSKLAHGGLRYLKQFELGLVAESLRERNLLLKNAPYLVRPLRFLYPAYKKRTEPLWMIRLGLALYDFLNPLSPMPRHQGCTTQEVAKEFPGIRLEGLTGGAFYYDAQMEDHRLVIENMLSAKEHGAVCINKLRATSFIYKRDRVIGVRCGTESFFGKCTINTTGPWANETLKLTQASTSPVVRPTKGIHIVIDSLHSNTALLLKTPQDDRVFFLMPWKGHTLVGTTESDYYGDPSRLKVNNDEVKYLIEAVNFYFPKRNLTGYQVRAAFAGLRPLVHTAEESLNAASRDHLIQNTAPGLLTMVGGKYTTYRAMAEEALNRAVSSFNLKSKPCSTKTTPLFERNPKDLILFDRAKKEDIAIRYGEHANLITHLIAKYGQGYHKILDSVMHNPLEGRPLCPCHPHVLGEVTYAIEEEGAQTLSDWFFRRSSMGYTGCRGLKAAPLVAEKFASHFGWDRVKRDQEIKDYGQFIRDEMAVYGGSPQRL